MASEKRILTLTLIVLLVVFLSFNTVLPCWVLGQCSQQPQEGFQEAALPGVGELSRIPGMNKKKVDTALDDVVNNKAQCFHNKTGQFNRKCVLEGDAKTLVSHSKLGNVAIDELQKRYNNNKNKSTVKSPSANVAVKGPSANVAKAPSSQPK